MKKKENGLTAVLFIMIFLIAAVLAMKIAGIKLYAVSSPSMKPALGVGELVVVVPKPFEKLQQGDIITYYISPNLNTATHRIFAVNAERKTFVTKGDHNETPDGGNVLYGNVVGKVVINIPRAGYFLQYLSTWQGKLTAGAVLLIFLIFIFFWGDPKNKRKQSDAEENNPDIAAKT